jgi:hypothetical protein
MQNDSKVHDEMTALLKTMPLLQGKLAYWPDGIDADGLVVLAYRGASHGEKCVIEFMLSVWDPGADWSKSGFRNFHLAEAVPVLGGGSSPEVQAIIRWMEKPFFP